jgi:hypothetical protein
MSSSNNPSSPPEDRWPESKNPSVGSFPPDHSHAVPEQVREIIWRAEWCSAKSVEDVAPHQYVVIGWDRDDVTDGEFWLVVRTIETLGRVEEWTPPEGFYDSGNRRPVTNRYLYVATTDGLHAYWFTHPRNSVPMLNREHVSVQQQTPTRRVVEPQQHMRLPDPPAQTQLEVRP